MNSHDALSLTVPTHIFREYDVRGIAEKDLSGAFAAHLGYCYARFLPQGARVTVGRDCRLTGERLTSDLITGMRRAGLNVTVLGVCPTPLTYFSTHHLKSDGGVMVTGSHNPSEYNGFKICVGRTTIHGEDIQKLRRWMEETPLALGPVRGTIEEYPIIDPYIEWVTNEIGSLPKLKIVLDAGNGTAGSVAPKLFRLLGAEVIELFCDLDGRFPNHHPDPTVPENLTELVNKVRETGADFGCGFDGDSDRLGIVDNNGRIVYGDELMVLLARSVLKANPGATIISEVKSSHRLYQDIAKNGGVPIMWKTGHSLIKSKMKETKAALAGEMSGHIFFADRYFGYDDAIYSAARLYEIIALTRQSVSEHLSDLTPMVATPEIRVDCEEDKKFDLVTRTRKLLEDQKYNVNPIDGVRVDFGDSWGLVRASNTQPVLVLRFEAPTQNRLVEVREIVEGALRKAAQEIRHTPLAL